MTFKGKKEKREIFVAGANIVDIRQTTIYYSGEELKSDKLIGSDRFQGKVAYVQCPKFPYAQARMT